MPIDIAKPFLGKDPAKTIGDLWSSINLGFRKLFELTAILNGVLVEDVKLSASAPQYLRHNLGRPARGFVVVKKAAAFDVYVAPETNKLEASALLVRTTAADDQTVSAWVF